MIRNLLLMTTALSLSGCFAGSFEMADFKGPGLWQNAAQDDAFVAEVEPEALQNWWLGFNDQALNTLIKQALDENPDRKAAEARIFEARGLRKTARAGLLPQIGASASTGREKTVQSKADDYYDARFDASYEVDIFGANRNRFGAARATLERMEAQYQDVTLSLIAEVARSYIEMRANEKQALIAQNNLEAQMQTLQLIRYLKDAGENPQLDVERAENLVNTTKASIPEYQRRAENARLQLAALTGRLPEDLMDLTPQQASIPTSDIAPVMMAPAKVLAIRPDIRAAAANLRAQTDLAEAATADIFPKFTLGGFYGVAENAFASSTGIWNVAIGAAVSLLDFGRLAGQVDAARAREKEAYELYRGTVLDAVREVETALNDYARINESTVLLFKAYANAQEAFNYSEDLFKEGEISFLDVLDAQRTVNTAQSNLISAEEQKAAALIRLYKSLGVGP